MKSSTSVYNETTFQMVRKMIIRSSTDFVPGSSVIVQRWTVFIYSIAVIYLICSRFRTVGLEEKL